MLLSPEEAAHVEAGRIAPGSAVYHIAPCGRQKLLKELLEYLAHYPIYNQVKTARSLSEGGYPVCFGVEDAARGA